MYQAKKTPYGMQNRMERPMTDIEAAYANYINVIDKTLQSLDNYIASYNEPNLRGAYIAYNLYLADGYHKT
jgi:hypothetical protein